MTTAQPIYLDCNATTPIEPEVLDLMNHYFRIEYGNAGSRTHRYGSAAAQAVRRAREQLANVVAASWENVLFTSGATESNNLAILGLAVQAENDLATSLVQIVDAQAVHFDVVGLEREFSQMQKALIRCSQDVHRFAPIARVVATRSRMI